MNDIVDLFHEILTHSGSVDIAEAEFKRMIHEDPDLRARYRDYCHEVGSSEKRGFLDYCEEYLDSQESIWDDLKEFEDE